MNILAINEPCIVSGATRAFERYDQALTSNDVAVLDELFFGTDLAIANIDFARKDEPGIGRQSHTWVRYREGRRIVSAHVLWMDG